MAPQGSTFDGQSPAPTYPSLPDSVFGSLDAPSVLDSQLGDETGSLGYRYNEPEEEQLWDRQSGVETSLEPAHPETLATLSELGQIIINQGRYKSAEGPIHRLVECRRSLYSDDNVDTLKAFSLLGQVLWYQGLYVKAGRPYQRVLEGCEKVLGLEHSDTLSSVNNIRLVLERKGEYEEAEAMH